jgi:dienelactone hydrolase
MADVSLTSRRDGFSLGAYHAAPPDARRGGLVLVQEIFGVTPHIRELADGYARDGYETLAPSFYDRRIPELIEETPRCPIILHFGRRDLTIPSEVVDAIAETHPDVPIHLYDAGHGFVSDRRADYNADCARLARLRTLQLFALNGAGRSEV